MKDVLVRAVRFAFLSAVCGAPFLAATLALAWLLKRGW